MPKLSSNFTGVLDRDSDYRYIEKGNYTLLENGIIDRMNGNDRYLVKNLPSTLLKTTLPLSGDFVGGEMFQDFYYAFYYEELTNELTMYRINPVNTDDYVIVFKVTLEDNILLDEGTEGGGGSSLYNLFSKLSKYGFHYKCH